MSRIDTALFLMQFHSVTSSSRWRGCLHELPPHTSVLGWPACSKQTNVCGLEVWFDCTQPRCKKLLRVSRTFALVHTVQNSSLVSFKWCERRFAVIACNPAWLQATGNLSIAVVVNCNIDKLGSCDRSAETAITKCLWYVGRFLREQQFRCVPQKNKSLCRSLSLGSQCITLAAAAVWRRQISINSLGTCESAVCVRIEYESNRE